MKPRRARLRAESPAGIAVTTASSQPGVLGRSHAVAHERALHAAPAP